MVEEKRLMKISVIIPMYNSEETILRALNSIKNQTAIKEIGEIIVVNDGSTDNSLDIVKNYSKENKKMPIKIIDKKNGGVSSARNVGLKMAKEEYIALLDSDDEWLPEKTKIQLEILKSNPNIDFLGCNQDNIKLKMIFRRIDKLYKVKLNDLLIKMFPTTPSVIFKRSILDKIGFYDETRKYGEDANYWLKICMKCNFYVIPISLVITKGGKPSFGYRGLSANLKKMHEGYIINIKELKKDLIINNRFYIFLRILYLIKYIRRIIISKLR